MAGDHARSIPSLRGRPPPDLPRFTPCRRREQAFELTQPGVRHTPPSGAVELAARRSPSPRSSASLAAPPQAADAPLGPILIPLFFPHSLWITFRKQSASR